MDALDRRIRALSMLDIALWDHNAKAAQLAAVQTIGRVLRRHRAGLCVGRLLPRWQGA